MSAGRRAPGWLLPVALVLAGTVALVLIGRDEGGAGPLDPRSDDRRGTSAMVVLAREFGAEVRVTDRLPGDDTDVYVVLADFFDDEQLRDLRSWMDRGGTTVVLDDASSLTPDDGEFFDGTDDMRGLLPGTPRCEVDALEGIDGDRIRPRGFGTLFDIPPGADSCVGDSGLAYIVVQARGQGDLVSVGGPGLFINEALGDADNAAVVAALLAPEPGTRVDVLRPGPPTGGGERTLIDLVASNVWAFMAQLLVAFLVLVVWRSRRLGKPVAEPQPVAVAGSELVAAVGTLLDRSGSPQHAADTLRADLRRFLGDRLGVPADAPAGALAAVAHERIGLDRARLEQALGDAPVDDDAQLVALAQLVDAVRREVLAHV